MHNSGFWKAKILRLAKILNSGFWEAKILKSAKKLEFRLLESQNFYVAANTSEAIYNNDLEFASDDTL